MNQPRPEDIHVRAGVIKSVAIAVGDPDGPAGQAHARWQAALAQPGVRGLVLGRAILYPQDGDVTGAVDAACALVHP